ncbi:MAG: tetratricopeptide repeat protein, partial [Geobacteraceae bacterium]|nr:tetratricopeptide repeat protein [Geobacteraceae bacterium]
MTSQKQKFLASAQKYIQKGQFERALKDYEQVVTADPKDVKHRQKLAELLVRCNRREDAIREYETIARYYDDNGFNLKAIAVYKQIQRLNPSNIEISLSLAALNEKQGMIGNALSEYRTVFLHYEKSGRAEDALQILEKMRGVDPDNADIMRKLAETLYASGAKDKSYQEFTHLALVLKNRGMSEYYEKICSIIASLFPEKTDSSLDILSEQIRNGVAGDALPRLNQLLGDDPDNPKILALLAEAYRISGDFTNRKEILKRLIPHKPGDLSLIKGLIECSVEEKDVEGSLSLIEEYQSTLYESGAL